MSLNNTPECAPSDLHHVWSSGLDLMEVAVTDSILMVVYLLLVSTHIIEVGSPSKSQFSG